MVGPCPSHDRLPPPPLPGAILEECYTPRSLPSSCLTRVSATWVTRADAEKALAESVDGVFIDTRPLLCTSGLCPAFVGDSVVKSDLNHLTPRYASVIAPVLAELLTRRGFSAPPDRVRAWTASTPLSSRSS
ncbi:SGNH hydrolase domain-containing protein [Frondihabitans sp. VKM Ac-2883]|uniref:SGNH hydrolase domain-containing protein n=1 Tax=Frondihabitans sp. VKM Ac-2883 TaxID=2783823 RepID=UPI00188CC541|nr:SGNH hydrolase domain-containing protein [Frondihabitans sp. VKM Ac-2883]MBF4576671.1 hypothetical protein [Frondihabitans sp. VKM Ac-2883]